MAVIFIFDQHGVSQIREATHTPVTPRCFTGADFMRCAVEQLQTLQGVTPYPCHAGLLDLRLADAYINACAYVNETIAIDCGYRPIDGASVSPCNLGMGLIMGAKLGDKQREELRLKLIKSAAFAKISPQCITPRWICASVAIPTPPPHIEIGYRGIWAAILNQLLERSGFAHASIDGRFDRAKQRALCLYQSYTGLSVTGSADAATWSALGL